jgi:hypothetical protein
VPIGTIPVSGSSFTITLLALSVTTIEGNQRAPVRPATFDFRGNAWPSDSPPLVTASAACPQLPAA